MQFFNQSKIQKVLECAANTTYYSNLFSKHNIDIKNISSLDEFQKIPITTKDIYKENLWNCISSDISQKLNYKKIESIGNNYIALDNYLAEFNLKLTLTSGSTGIPLNVIHSKFDEHRNYFSLNLNRLRYNKFELRKPYLWILPMNPKTKSYFYNKYDKFILNENNILFFLVDYSEKNISILHNTVCKYNIDWITGSSTALEQYAEFIIKHNIFHTFSYIEVHSEPLLPWQNQKIRKAFHCEPACIYSSNEIEFIAQKCKHGHYHVLDDNVYVELLDSYSDQIKSKRVVLTSLNSYICPFIRYEIGDLAEEVHNCNCGFSEFAFDLKGYRDSDFIFMKNRIVEPYIVYDAIYFLEKKINYQIEFYQVRQKSFYQFELWLENKLFLTENKHKIEQYVSGFFTDALEQKVKINIVFLNFNQARKIKAKYKYKRFKSDINN